MSNNNGKPISNTETFFILKNNKEKYKNKTIKSHEVFLDSLEYVENIKKIEDVNACENLKNFLIALGFLEEESIQFLNLLPLSVTEIKILIPTLSRLTDPILESAIVKTKEIAFI